VTFEPALGMDVNGAGHDDLAEHVIGLIGRAALRQGGNDVAILDEHVAHGVAAVDGINDPAAFEPDQHARASRLPIRSAIPVMTSTTVGASWLGLVAFTMPMPAISDR
jgi:hypothetical protein